MAANTARVARVWIAKDIWSFNSRSFFKKKRLKKYRFLPLTSSQIFSRHIEPQSQVHQRAWPLAGIYQVAFWVTPRKNFLISHLFFFSAPVECWKERPFSLFGHTKIADFNFVHKIRLRRSSISSGKILL